MSELTYGNIDGRETEPNDDKTSNVEVITMTELRLDCIMIT